MTESITAYERDPYATRLTTTVREQGDGEGGWAVLADTIFYPEGGGQPADRGCINGVEVVDVQRVEGQIRHFLVRSLDQSNVELELDWYRRYDHMQQHTGQHLLTALAADLFGWATTAFHLGSAVSDIELDVATLLPGQLAELEEAVARQIRAALPVRTRRVDREEYEQLDVRTRGLPKSHQGSIRLVEIEGLDLNTCGGTHVHSTAELECLKLLETESMRGGTRLYYVAGGRVRSLLGAHEERASLLRSLLNCSNQEMPGVIGVKLETLKATSRQIRDLERELASLLAERLCRNHEVVSELHFEDRGLQFLQALTRAFVESGGRLLFASSGLDGSFAIGGNGLPGSELQQAGRDVAELLGGKGGGNGPLFQGKASSFTKRGAALDYLGKKVSKPSDENDRLD